MKKSILTFLVCFSSLVGFSMANAPMCPTIYEPVCGIDGITYGNQCAAGDVEIAHEGVCLEDSKACTLEYEPVCGIDGITYGNQCAAGDVEIAHQGECHIIHPLAKDETPLATLIDWGHKEGLTIFQSVLTFMPEQYVTRELAAKMIAQTLHANNILLPQNTIIGCISDDDKNIDPTLKSHVDKMCQRGLYQGYKNNIMPKDYLTFSHINTIIQRIAIKTNEQKVAFDSLPPEMVTHKPLTRKELLHILYTYTMHMPVDQDDTNLTQIQETLNQARQKRSNDELMTYDLIQKTTCFCPQEYVRPMKFSVISGAIDSSTVVYADDQTKVTLDNPRLMTINEAFDTIQKAIKSHADSITVEYDPFYGYPTMISIDHDYGMADEEEYYEFTLIIDGQGNNNLQGTWNLSMFDGKDVGEYESELLFSANRMSVKFCNHMGGTYAIDQDKKLSFGTMMSTKMACQDETLMDMELAFGKIQLPVYTLTDNNNKLTITEGNHTFVFTR